MEATSSVVDLVFLTIYYYQQLGDTFFVRWYHSQIKDLLTPGVLLNKVGVSTSTKPAKKKEQNRNRWVESRFINTDPDSKCFLYCLCLVCMFFLNLIKFQSNSTRLNSGSMHGGVNVTVCVWRWKCFSAQDDHHSPKRLTEQRNSSVPCTLHRYSLIFITSWDLSLRFLCIWADLRSR